MNGQHVLSTSRLSLAALVLLAVSVLPHAALAQPIAPADAFADAVSKNSSLPAEIRELVARTWRECDGCDGEEFLTQGLVVISMPFRAGLDAYDDDQYAACAEAMRDLLNDEDPFLSTNAACYEIKALVAREQLDEAGGRIRSLRDDNDQRLRTYTYFAAEMAFLDGYCYLADLDYEKATATLEAFLKEYPEDSQRLTLSAQQMLSELAIRQPEQIGEVVDLMTYSGRRLKNEDSGDTVRVRQKRIVELLDKMIEEAEKQEQSSQDSSSGGGGGGGKQSNQPGSPLKDSQIPGGATPGTGPLRESRKASPGETWGAMPPAKRQEILQALKDSFPGQYRRLVEQYYTELAKKK
ncbi:MAG: hypothetical protein ACYTHJ_01615 [Planctomycetota bacterium]|jgi:tetratricopeptide (TPR) repeat protein